MTCSGGQCVISQYDNEKAMNGGEVSPGIFAFDLTMDSFSPCVAAVS